MGALRAHVREELGKRIAGVSSRDFIRGYVCRALPEHAGTSNPDGGVEVFTVQNDGTGPATIEYRIRGSTRLFGKLYTDGSGAHAYEVLRHLWHAGFDRTQRYQVPEPLCFIAEYNLLMMREGRGESLATRLGCGNGAAVEGVREAARWLLKLHGSSVRVGNVERPWYVFLKLADRLSKAAASHPQELGRLNGMLARLEQLGHGFRERAAVQAHGQFRPIHVFLSGDAVAVIDLDRSAPSDPARDLGEFIHRLRSRVLRSPGTISHADFLTRAFLNEYAAERPSALEHLPFYRGFHVLASFCRHIKQLEAGDPEWEPTIALYTDEFERAMARE